MSELMWTSRVKQLLVKAKPPPVARPAPVQAAPATDDPLSETRPSAWVTAEIAKLDASAREAYLKRIRFLQEGYGLGWLIDQETFGRAGLVCLTTPQLGALLQKLEQARRCADEGIAYEDVGLVQEIEVPDTADLRYCPRMRRSCGAAVWSSCERR